MAECHEQLNNEPYVVPPAEYVQGNVAAYKRENEQMRTLLENLEGVSDLFKSDLLMAIAAEYIIDKYKELKESWK